MEIQEELIFNFKGAKTSYLTHSLHPYPAKFPPQLPKMILAQFGKKGQTVLDPFCGSGTTLVEANLHGLNAIGVDVNGLSTLLSRVKATPLNEQQQDSIISFIDSIKNQRQVWELIERPTFEIKDIKDVKHWFQNNVAEELTYILQQIAHLTDTKVKDFLKIVLSSIIVRVSNQDSDTRYAATKKDVKDYFTIDLFIIRVLDYLKKMIEFSTLVTNDITLDVFNADSRDLSFIKPESIDLIITSPPYANTYDYYLYHKFRKRWLDLDVKFAQNNEIGSRREYSSLKKNPTKWNEDLKKCFLEMNKVLKKGGLAFVVIGDSVIKREIIKADEIIRDFAYSTGFEIENIISSDLAGHSRIFNPTFAKKDKKEHLITLKKLL
jgi:site-specific DNA-methyltransferase (cytosine-N4-specific)